MQQLGMLLNESFCGNQLHGQNHIHYLASYFQVFRTQLFVASCQKMRSNLNTELEYVFNWLWLMRGSNMVLL